MSVWSHFGASVICFVWLASGSMLQGTCAIAGRNANAEHKRGMGHAESLLESVLIQAPVVTSYTASSLHSIGATRRFLHDTTLSCLPLDADSDAVALHDGNLTEELSHAAAIC